MIKGKQATAPHFLMLSSLTAEKHDGLQAAAPTLPTWPAVLPNHAPMSLACRCDFRSSGVHQVLPAVMLDFKGFKSMRRYTK